MQSIMSVFVALRETSRRLVPSQDGFQTAEAIGISAVGLLVLFAIWGALSVLGVDMVDWIRSSFGVGSGSPLPPPAG